MTQFKSTIAVIFIVLFMAVLLTAGTATKTQVQSTPTPVVAADAKTATINTSAKTIIEKDLGALSYYFPNGVVPICPKCKKPLDSKAKIQGIKGDKKKAILCCGHCDFCKVIFVTYADENKVPK